MNGFLDWREIELQNDWGLREKSDAMAMRWDEGAQMWDDRWKNEAEFTKLQADALDLSADDTVLDVGCGTGPLTVYIAPRVKKVIAFDFGKAMLKKLMDNCREKGISNVECLQGNWYEMEPGRDIPICDVAITRWSPAHGDILKFSRCARKWCWSVSTCEPHFTKNGHQQAGQYWCRSTEDESLNTTPRPCGRKYGLNVHFNLLYDHGANPSIKYLVDEKETIAASKEELLGVILGKQPSYAGVTKAMQNAERMVLQNVEQLDDGTWRHYRKHTVAIMGWNPHELIY